ncbi:MAG TPA: hypothetical protein DD435_12380 [Cyanobacteria bacterium UBA8530]|nr:hypothetical protein [Cyanobacteria bacterium UBA8530]
MDRLKKLAGQKAFHFGLFFLCLFLFNWPLLTVIPLDRQGLLFFYLFIASGFFIFLLFLSSRSAGEDESGV